jgi:hypothetical protein
MSPRHVLASAALCALLLAAARSDEGSASRPLAGDSPAFKQVVDRALAPVGRLTLETVGLDVSPQPPSDPSAPVQQASREQQRG